MLSDGPHRLRSPALRRTCFRATEWKAGRTTAALGRHGKRRHASFAIGRYAPASSEFAPAGSRQPPHASLTEDGIDRSDAFPDPAHDRDRHRIAERPVAWPIGSQPAAILDQGVIVGKPLEAFALSRG